MYVRNSYIWTSVDTSRHISAACPTIWAKLHCRTYANRVMESVCKTLDLEERFTETVTRMVHFKTESFPHQAPFVKMFTLRYVACLLRGKPCHTKIPL